MQHMAAADRVARHHRHDRLRAAADLPLKIEHVQMMDAALIPIAAVVAAHLLIAPGAEGQIACAGEDNDANALVVTRIL